MQSRPTRYERKEEGGVKEAESDVVRREWYAARAGLWLPLSHSEQCICCYLHTQ